MVAKQICERSRFSQSIVTSGKKHWFWSTHALKAQHQYQHRHACFPVRQDSGETEDKAEPKVDCEHVTRLEGFVGHQAGTDEAHKGIAALSDGEQIRCRYTLVSPQLPLFGNE